MNKSTPATKKPKLQYESNPFKSSFDGMSRLFKLSQTAAIVLLVLGLFGVIFNNFGVFPFPIDSTEPAETAANTSSTTSSGTFPVAAIVLLASFGLTALLIAIAIGVLWTGVVNYVAWKNSQNQEADLGEALRESFKRFWTILGLSIIVGLKVFFGFILFIVPGARALLRYQMVYIAMFDENLGVSKSMERMKTLTKKHLMEVFGIATVSQLLFPVQTIVQVGGHSILYPQLKELKAKNLPKPPTHWLNYLGFIIAGFILSFVSFVVLLIAIIAR